MKRQSGFYELVISAVCLVTSCTAHLQPRSETDSKANWPAHSPIDMSHQPPAIPGPTVSPVPILGGAEANIFPSSWLGSPFRVRADSLSSEDFERGRSVVLNAMSSYPASLIQQQLREVYLLKDLQISELSTAGTNARTRIYLRVLPLEYAQANTELTEAFHHEFSSILLRNYSRYFPAQKWKSCNDQHFVYLPSQADSQTVRDASVGVDLPACRDGFVNDYGKTDIENDFNLIAAHLFVGDAAFIAALDESPRLRQKANIVIEFYRAIDPLLLPRFSTPGSSHPTGNSK